MGAAVDVTSPEPDTTAAEQVKKELTEAEQVFAAVLPTAYWKDDYEKLKSEGMDDEAIYQALSDSYAEGDLAPLADVNNARRKQRGVEQGVADTVESKTSEAVSTATTGKKLVNGEPMENVVVLTDKDGNEWVLVEGDVSITDNGVTSDSPIIVEDKEGNRHTLQGSDYAAVSLSPEDYAAAKRTELTAKAAGAIGDTPAPEGEKQGETVTVGGEAAKPTAIPTGRALTKEEADKAVGDMEATAEDAVEQELTAQSWSEAFAEDGTIETPIGRVKMGDGQFAKFFTKGREKEFGMVAPTLTRPDVIIEETSEAKEGQETERASSYVFVKTFNKDGKKVKMYASITVKRDGMEVSVSSHYMNKSAVSRKMQEGKVIYAKEASPSSSSDRHLAEHRNDVPDLLPTQESNASSVGKDTNSSPSVQEKASENDGWARKKDKHGRPDWTTYPHAETYEALEGKRKGRAVDSAAAQTARADEELSDIARERARKKAPKGVDPEECLDGLDAREAEARRRKEYWDGIVKHDATVRAEEIEAKRLEAEADRKEREDAKKMGAEWAAVAREVSGIPEAEAVLNDWEPRTLEEEAASWLAGAKLLWDSDGVRQGVRQETGWGGGEQRKFLGLWANREKDGISLKELAHRMWEECDKSIRGEATDQDCLNALLGVLSECNGMGEIRSYVKRRRQEEALGIKRDMEEAEDRQREEEFWRSHGCTIEEWEAEGEELAKAYGPEMEEYEQSKENDHEDNGKPGVSGGDSGSGAVVPRGEVPAGEVNGAEGSGGRGEEAGGGVPSGPEEGAGVKGETDHNGHLYLTAADGSTTFGNITAETGLKAAPIRLSEGQHSEDGKGYGKAHIEANHGEQIRRAGFKSVEDFVEYVASHYEPEKTKEGKKRADGTQTYLIQIEDKHSNVLFIELATDGTHYDVNSGGIFRKGYTEKKEKAGARSEVAPSQADSEASSLPARDDSSSHPAEPNGDSEPSGGKGSDNPPIPQGKAGEKDLSRSVEELVSSQISSEGVSTDEAAELSRLYSEAAAAVREGTLDAFAETHKDYERVDALLDGVINGLGIDPEKLTEERVAEILDAASRGCDARPVVDAQGNPIDAEGKLVTERVKDVSEITDADFTSPTRTVELPTLPDKVQDALGTDGKPVIIKKNIFARNSERHSDITPQQSREILQKALFSPDLYGQNQKAKRPNNWVVVSLKDADGNNRLVVLEVNHAKDNVEIVHWHEVDDRGLEKIKRQAEREDGQLLILPSDAEEAGALSGPAHDLPAGKGSDNPPITQGKAGEKAPDDAIFAAEPSKAERERRTAAVQDTLPREEEGADGRVTRRSRSGVLREESQWKGDRRDGVKRVYAEDGTIRGYVEYKDGKQDGLTVRYDDKGRPQIVAQFKGGKNHGVLMHYEDGKLSGVSYYSDGRKIQEKSYNKKVAEGDLPPRPVTRYRKPEADDPLTQEELDNNSPQAMGEAAEHFAASVGVKVNVVTDATQLLDNGKREALGFTENGEATIVVSNHKSVGDVLRTAWHEVVSHVGLRQLLGEERYNKVCRKVFWSADLTKWGREMVASYEDMAAQGILDGVFSSGTVPKRFRDLKPGQLVEYMDSERVQEYVGDELLANHAEDGRFRTVSNIKILKGALRDLAHRLGISEAFTEDDYDYLHWRANRKLGAGSEGAEGVRYRRIDVAEMSRDDKARRGEKLRTLAARDVAVGVIKAAEGVTARKAAQKWWSENVGEPQTFGTEIGDVTIDEQSVRASLSHGFSQKKLDAVVTLTRCFPDAVYIGSKKDFSGKPIDNHFFAYPINYRGERNYVLCRVRQDINTNRLYVHEVFLEESIEKGNAVQTGAPHDSGQRSGVPQEDDTLQTAARRPHGGIALYKDILSDVLGAKVGNSPDTAKETEENVSPARFRFIGEKGAANADKAEEGNARLDNLRVARDMEKAGKDAKDAKLATGWERGADGKWRYEEGDVKINRLHFPNRDGQYEIPLKQFLANDSSSERLFAAYPGLRATRVMIADYGYDYVGAYNKKNDTLRLNSKILLDENGDIRESAMGVVCHEIQHAIQHIEGFATGSNVVRAADYRGSRLNATGYGYAMHQCYSKELSMAIGLKYNNLALLDKIHNGSKKGRDEATRKKDEREAYMKSVGYLRCSVENGDCGDGLREALIAEMEKSGWNYENEKLFVETHIDEIHKAIKDKVGGTLSDWNEYESLSGLTPEQVYLRVSGEVEARNVETRAEMSDEERRRSLASETEDVSRADQLFFYGIEEAHMGSRVRKRQGELAKAFGSMELDEKQRAVADVFSGKKDRQTFKVKREDGERVLEMMQGNENNAGAKHSVFRHFNTATGWIGAEDIVRIPEVLENGTREVEKSNAVYTLDADVVKYKVVTDIKNGKEIFHTFCTNRKAKSPESSSVNDGTNTNLIARTSEEMALQGAKVGNSPDTAKETEENVSPVRFRRVTDEKKLRELDEADGGQVKFRKREKPDPTRTIKMYKLFKVDSDGKPHALFIDRANALERGVFYDADSPQVKDLEHLDVNHSYLLDANGNVVESRETEVARTGGKARFVGLPPKSAVNKATEAGQRWMTVTLDAAGSRQYHTVGINGSDSVSTFALRPGWHATDKPTARHIGNGYRRPDERWFEIEVAADKDYNEEARQRYMREHPKMSREKIYQELKGDIPERIPEDGFYDFRTNSNANPKQRWVISGSMRIVRPVSEAETRRVCQEQGVEGDLPYTKGKAFSEDDTKETTLRFRRAEEERDKEYLSAVERGDMEAAQRMVDEEARRKGYDSNSDYMGGWINGSAPYSNSYYETKAERIEAYKSGELEDTVTLDDYATDGVDLGLFGEAFSPRMRSWYQRRGERDNIESIDNLLSAVERVRDGEQDVRIKMYRAVRGDIKEGGFRNGDWITPSRTYARKHAKMQDWENSRIIEEEVPLDSIWSDGNDIREWGYDDGKGYAYSNVRNNRKFLDAVTRDDNGNVIPLSARFDKKVSDVRYRRAGAKLTVADDMVLDGRTHAELADAIFDHNNLMLKLQRKGNKERNVAFLYGDDVWFYHTKDGLASHVYDRYPLNSDTVGEIITTIRGLNDTDKGTRELLSNLEEARRGGHADSRVLGTAQRPGQAASGLGLDGGGVLREGQVPGRGGDGSSASGRASEKGGVAYRRAETRERVGREGLDAAIGREAHTAMLDALMRDTGNEALKGMRREIGARAARNGWDIREAAARWLSEKAAADTADTDLWDDVREMMSDTVPGVTVPEARYLSWLSENKGRQRDPMFLAEAAAMRRKIERMDYTPEIKDGEYVERGDSRAVTHFRKGKKTAPETAEHLKRNAIATVISSADGAKLRKDVETYARKCEKMSRVPKTFLGDLAHAIGSKDKGHASQYATFETEGGKQFTIRVSNHNAHVSNFDANGEREGVSIVVSRNPNRGMENDGEAHVTEWFYSDKKLNNATGNEIAGVVRSVGECLKTGEYTDTTGLAERQEVNVPVTHYRKSTPTPSTASAMERYDAALQEKSFKWREGWIDKMESLRKLMEAVTGEKDIYKWADGDNAYLMENHATSRAQAEWDTFRKYREYQTLEKALDKCIGVIGGNRAKALDAMETHMAEKHGLERNRVFYVRDQTEPKKGDSKTEKARKEQARADFLALRARLSAALKSGKLTFRQSLEQQDGWITKNLNADYDPNRNDYSGISAFDPERKVGGGA